MGYYDFVKIKKYLKEGEKLNTDHLKLFKEEIVNSTYKLHYKLSNKHNECLVIFHPDFNILELELSIPYFWKGNNYKISLEEESAALQYISTILQVDLFTAEVIAFEFGTLLQIPFHYKYIQRSHLKMKGRKTITYPDGKYFNYGGVTQLKLYNGGKNLKKKVSKDLRMQLSATAGYREDSHYVKIEDRCNKPAIAFKKRTFTVANLFDPQFYKQCNINLMSNYKSVIKTKGVMITNKKQLLSNLIYLLAVISLEDIAEIDTEKHIMEVIGSYSNFLSVYDKRARTAQLREHLAKLQIADSPYDVSELLEQSLFGNK